MVMVINNFDILDPLKCHTGCCVWPSLFQK